MTTAGETLHPKAVIWDMDGVIVDTEAFHFEAWRRLLCEHRIELTEADFKRTFGMRNADILQHFLGPQKSESELRLLAAKKEEYFRSIIQDQITASIGAVRLIRDLAETGFPQAIASSAPRANIDLIISRLDLTRFFSVIVAEEDVTTGKPDPQIFLLAASRLNVMASSCIVIEDSVAGIRAAKAAGMKCIGVATTHPAASLVAADLVVRTIGELTVSDILALTGPDC